MTPNDKKIWQAVVVEIRNARAPRHKTVLDRQARLSIGVLEVAIANVVVEIDRIVCEVCF